VDTYTRQLRALEAHAKDHPKAADDRLVLAYHYLAMGQNDPAIKMLEQVTSLLPNDQLSAEILKALKPKAPDNSGRPTANAG
jgi:hypothetical protein